MAILIRKPPKNRTPFELGFGWEIPVIPGKKRTAENDDGLVSKNSRDDKI